MSNPFPPRSSIGGAYSGYNYADAGLRHGGLQTLSRAELPPAHSGAGYSTTISPHPSSALNNHNFMANATGSNTTAHAGSPQIPPPPFHVSSDLFKHFASSSLPPPPYPPVPIPHLGFPQFPPPPPHFAATSTPPNNFLMGSSLSQQSNPLPLHIPPAPPEYHQNTLTIAREEGELSDGELDASSAKSVIVPTQPGSKAQSRLSAKPAEIAFSNQEEYSARTQPMTSAPHSTLAASESAVKQVSAASRAALSDSSTMGNVFQRPTEAGDNRVPSADGDSISSYNPPSASTPGSGEPDMELMETQGNTSDSAKPLLPAKADHMEPATLLLREQAKDAVRSLVPHNIKYIELIREGVDPYVLRSLYEDLDQDFVLLKTASPAFEVQRLVEIEKIASQSPQPTEELPDPSLRNMNHEQQQGAGTIRASTNLISANSESDKQPQSTVPKSSKASVSATLHSEKAPIAMPSSNVAIERKDRIAQLLAAKTGKAIPPRPVPERRPDAPAETPKPHPALEAAITPLSLPAKPPLPSLEATAKPKNKAQTELIRQKMEALKKEALCKSQAQGMSKVDMPKAASVPSSPASATPQYPVDSRKLGPAESAADSNSNGVVSAIPGLFMTNLADVGDFPSVDRRSEPPQMEKVDEPMSVNSTASSVSQEATTDFESNFVQSPGGHMLPVRLPQKRPLASDSFDEAGPSAKRPFGQKESYDKIEIVLSEEESDGEVEDVEMELDGESDEEKPTPQDGIVSAVSVRGSTIRNLPPLTDFPSSNPTSYSTSVINTPTSTAAQTPGREKDKEELWKAKHQEIELMRKKIAEMEERRKVKQSVTHASSPKATGNAATPVIRTSFARPSHPSSPGLPKPPPPVGANADILREAVQSPVLAPSRPDELPSTPSTPLHAIKEPVKAEDLRQRLLRRKATREGTPNAAEIEIRRAQLAEKRANLAELKREAERREAEILEESRLLEAQLHAELNGEDAYGEQSPNSDDNAEDNSIASHQAAADAPQQNGDAPIAHGEGFPAHTTEQSSSVCTSQCSSADQKTVPQPSEENSNMRQLTADALTSLNRTVDTYWEFEKSLHTSRPADEPVDVVTALRQRNLSAAPIPEANRVEVESLPPIVEDGAADEAPVFQAADSDIVDEDGSVSMSDSASEDYEPADPDRMGDDQPENDSESYEPADVADPVDAPQLSASTQDEVIGPAQIDQTVTRDASPSTKPAYEEFSDSMLIDDAEDGMQLTEAVIDKPQIASQTRQADIGRTIPQASSHFTPYETPGKYFRNFRYHDHFPEIVPSGYKSMTFSNSIDPRKPFCPTELAEGTCEDSACKEQHFRQVALTDDKILAQMSTANNLKSKAEHDRWVAGLRQVIADLRSKGVKDFHLVASALAAYRRRFSEELSTPTSASSQS